MSKIMKETNKEFANIVKGQVRRLGIGTLENLSKRMGVCKATIVRKVNNPETLTVEELQRFVIILKLKPEEVLSLIYKGNYSTEQR